MPVEQNGKWGYINQSGDVVIPPTYNTAAHFSDGWARVEKDGEVFFINTDGETTLKPKVSSVESFSEGLAVATKAGSQKKGYINKQGKFVIEPRFIHAYAFSEEKAAVCTKKMGLCGYINPKGETVIKLSLAGARKFVDGLAPAKTGDHFNGGWGYIDTEGGFVIKPTYRRAMPFSEGMAAVNTAKQFGSNRWGFINTKGEIVIKGKYDLARAFKGGVAPVESAGHWKFIDTKGDYVFSRIGNKLIGYLEPFRGNLAFASTSGMASITYGLGKISFQRQQGDWVYLDRSGKKVWPKVKSVAPPGPVEAPSGYAVFNASWSKFYLSIPYPKEWTTKDFKKLTGYIEGVSFIKERKAADELFADGKMHMSSKEKIRLVSSDNIIINMNIQPKGVSGRPPEKYITSMGAPLLIDPKMEEVKTYQLDNHPVALQRINGKDKDGRKVTSFHVAAKRQGHLVTLLAYKSPGSEKATRKIINSMLKHIKITDK